MTATTVSQLRIRNAGRMALSAPAEGRSVVVPNAVYVGLVATITQRSRAYYGVAVRERLDGPVLGYVTAWASEQGWTVDYMNAELRTCVEVDTTRGLEAALWVALERAAQLAVGN